MADLIRNVSLVLLLAIQPVFAHLLRELVVFEKLELSGKSLRAMHV